MLAQCTGASIISNLVTKTGNFALETGNSMHKPNIATPEADNGTSINGQGLPPKKTMAHTKKARAHPQRVIACPKLAIECLKLSMGCKTVNGTPKTNNGTPETVNGMPKAVKGMPETVNCTP